MKKPALAVGLAAATVLAGGLHPAAQSKSLESDLDEILKSPAVARALIGIRIESLRTGELLFARNSNKLVVPASNMKLLTMSVAAQKLGWDHRFETRLEAAGRIANGILTGDLIVTGDEHDLRALARFVSGVTVERLR